MISFNDFVEATRESEAQAIALNTYDTYLRSHENTMKKIPDAPPPYPITEDKIRGFLHYKLNQNEYNARKCGGTFWNDHFRLKKWKCQNIYQMANLSLSQYDIMQQSINSQIKSNQSTNSLLHSRNEGIQENDFEIIFQVSVFFIYI